MVRPRGARRCRQGAKSGGVPSFFPPLFAPPRLLSSVRIRISPGIRPIIQLAQERLKVLHRLDASWLSRPWDEVRRTLDFPTSSPSFSKRRVPTFIRVNPSLPLPRHRRAWTGYPRGSSTATSGASARPPPPSGSRSATTTRPGDGSPRRNRCYSPRGSASGRSRWRASKSKPTTTTTKPTPPTICSATRRPRRMATCGSRSNARRRCSAGGTSP